VDQEKFEKACALHHLICDLKGELGVWRAGSACLAKRDINRPEKLIIDHFRSAVAAEFWPAFASSCIAKLEARLEAAEQEFAEL
jgi:hypothetical protein